jgi:hypothetical protein
MSKFQIGDTAIGCYERDGHTEPIYSIVTGVLDNGTIEVVYETPYGTSDSAIIPETQACSLNCCHSCLHRLTRLVSGTCPATYEQIK